MDTTAIIAIIVATIVALGVIGLVIVLFYYHWRNRDLMTNFSAFIRENLQLKDEINRLQDENDELTDELDEVTGGKWSRRSHRDYMNHYNGY